MRMGNGTTTMNESRFSLRSLTLADWVLMALLAAANGVMTTGLSWVNKLLHSVGGPMLTSTIVGLYMIYGLLAIYVIRKPGAALVTYSLGACVQILMGSAYGAWSCIAAALCYAVVIEPLFYVFRYRQYNWFTMLFVGTAAVPLWFVVSAFMFGYIHYEMWVLIATLIIRCISGMLLCGALTKMIGDRIASTRAMRPFALGRESRGQ
ncbi:ECF transporter S component [Paenibacillus sp. MER 180]|uniref:ECF transporter S component n=2 Tax=Paenibacillus TaxID=44249 RepID=A0AAJ2K176_9BACL|nr:MULTISPECIES: ECF transporter S component [unclassified Paenibacillus]MCM3291175.1 ECF transporter S component [Paenibacillus sp. MER 180]MDT8978232.1 ECF transporter S component [Paenibacillus sp. chi10]